MADVMIDLETLGTSPDAAVVSIGVVIFDLDKKVILEEFYAPLDVKEQMKRGRKVDPDTLNWWMGQSDAAKKVFSEKAQDFKSILQTLSGILDKYRPLTVHGNSSTFDVSIMENAYAMYDVKLPWHYTKVNCFRTFRRFIGNNEKVEKTGIAHNALDDARDQVLYMFKHYNKNTSVNPTVPSDDLLKKAYGAGAATWEAKLEESEKKSLALVKAFKDADSNLAGKDITTDTLYQMMTEVRSAIKAIVGENDNG